MKISGEVDLTLITIKKNIKSDENVFVTVNRHTVGIHEWRN